MTNTNASPEVKEFFLGSFINALRIVFHSLCELPQRFSALIQVKSLIIEAHPSKNKEVLGKRACLITEDMIDFGQVFNHGQILDLTANNLVFLLRPFNVHHVPVIDQVDGVPSFDDVICNR